MKYKFTRRSFLAAGFSAATGLAVSGCSSMQPLFAGKDERRFKVGACDWTLGHRAQPSSFAAARELGLDGVQIAAGDRKGENQMSMLDSKKREEICSAARENNIKIASIGMAILNQVPLKSSDEAPVYVSKMIDLVDVFEPDARVILLAFFGDGDLLDEKRQLDKAARDVVVERLKSLADKAQANDVVLGIESWLSAQQHMDIIERVGSPALKVYYDVGNSHKAGYDIYKEIRQLGDNICEFHAKDYDDLYGKGSIDFVEVRKAMDDIGYSGWIQIEGTQFPIGRMRGLKYDADYLRTVFA